MRTSQAELEESQLRTRELESELYAVTKQNEITLEENGYLRKFINSLLTSKMGKDRAFISDEEEDNELLQDHAVIKVHCCYFCFFLIYLCIIVVETARSGSIGKYFS